MLILDKEQLKTFYSEKRKWQGIPGIEITKAGRIFATFYSGGATEQLGNYCVLIYSDDDGKSFSEPIAVMYFGEDHRAYDPCIWIDPLGRLWFICSVMPNHAVWASICNDPDGDLLAWSTPRIIGHDVMMNKPTVLESGEWLFPIAVWKEGITAVKDIYTTEESKRSFVYKSIDNGDTFELIGGADVPERAFDEHMILEMKDHSLMMLVRTFYGIGKSYSYDKGVTWTPGEDSGIKGPCSRFFIRRLSSGNVLLINHHNYTGRNNLTAMISRDDCKTWEGFLLLDERDQVSYPDAVEADNGYIYAIYDRERYGAKEILMAKFTERDVLAGKIVDEDSRLKVIVSKV